MRLHVSSTSAHRQEAKIVLYSLWYHHTYRWPSGAQVERGLDGMPSIQSIKESRFDFRLGLSKSSSPFFFLS